LIDHSSKTGINHQHPVRCFGSAAIRRGIEHAKANGDGYRGRKPSYSREQLEIVQNMLFQDANIIQIAKATNLSRQTVYRIKDDPVAAEAALATWGA
jgi:putative DNA-invertase from lambdoid prophage Rac